jgi:hypothetical protein
MNQIFELDLMKMKGTHTCPREKCGGDQQQRRTKHRHQLIFEKKTIRVVKERARPLS